MRRKTKQKEKYFVIGFLLFSAVMLVAGFMIGLSVGEGRGIWAERMAWKNTLTQDYSKDCMDFQGMDMDGAGVYKLQKSCVIQTVCKEEE